MNAPLIAEDDLKKWTGFRHRDALINWIRIHKIPYWIGNGGCICVTADAVNSALLRANSQTDENSIEF